MSDLAQKKAALAEARAKLAEAKKLADANKEDAKLAAAVQEANTAAVKALEEYTDALEKADPLTQSIEERLAKVRQEEKQKLYASLEKQKADKEEADKKAKELADKVKLLEDEKKKLEELQSKKKKEGDDTADLDARFKEVEERLTSALSKAEQEAAAVKLESAQQIAALQKELAVKEVETYKAKKLAELGNTVVPELVSGTTKEEIDNSIIKAQQARQRIVKEIEAARAGAGDEARNKVPTPPNPTVDLTQLTGQLTAEQIRKMPPDEWAKTRKSLGFK